MQASHHTPLLPDGYPEQHRCPLSMDEEVTGPGNHGLASMAYIWYSLLATPAVREGTEPFPQVPTQGSELSVSLRASGLTSSTLVPMTSEHTAHLTWALVGLASRRDLAEGGGTGLLPCYRSAS